MIVPVVPRINRMARPSLWLLPRYLMHYDHPVVSNWSQPTPPQAPLSAWNNPPTDTKINLDTNQSKETPSKSSLFYARPWEMILGSTLLLLLVACVLIPIFVTQSLQNTATATATLPSQCLSHTIILDPTRYYTYTATNNSCDNSSPFGSSPVWIRFAGASGTMLANSVVPMNQCGTTMTGYYNGTLPATGMTVQGTVCFSSSSNACSNPTTISVTSCTGFYVYYLTAVSSCFARYCTM